MPLEEDILKLLKEENTWMPTSKISILVRNGYYQVKIALEKMFENNLVEKTQKNRAAYWRIRIDDKI